MSISLEQKYEVIFRQNIGQLSNLKLYLPYFYGGGNSFVHYTSVTFSLSVGLFSYINHLWTKQFHQEFYSSLPSFLALSFVEIILDIIKVILTLLDIFHQLANVPNPHTTIPSYLSISCTPKCRAAYPATAERQHTEALSFLFTNGTP